MNAFSQGLPDQYCFSSSENQVLRGKTPNASSHSSSTTTVYTFSPSSRELSFHHRYQSGTSLLFERLGKVRNETMPATVRQMEKNLIVGPTKRNAARYAHTHTRTAAQVYRSSLSGRPGDLPAHPTCVCEATKRKGKLFRSQRRQQKDLNFEAQIGPLLSVAPPNLLVCQ